MLKTEGYENSELFMALTPKNGFKASKLYSYKPIDGTGDFHWSRNHTAYRLNQSGVLELMGNNVPRVDYTNTCPELLIEKASENLALRSQEFDNASWAKSNLNVTANSISAPDGTTTADTITSTGGTPVLFQQYTLSGDVTNSVYAKKGTSDYVSVIIEVPALASTWVGIFNLNTGVYVGNGGNLTADSFSITNVGNGWYRCTLTKNISGSFNTVFYYGVATASSINGTNGTNVYIWGGQIEQSDYATSYIPTTTTAQTRPKDICYNTANTFGDAAWSIVMRVRLNNIGSSTSEPLIALNDGSTDNYFCIYTDANPKLYFQWYNNPDEDLFQTTDLTNDIYNIGISYDDVSADYIIVIDGSLEFAGTLSVNPPGVFSNFSRLDLGTIAGTGNLDGDGIIGVQYYDSALSQSDLENLTTA